LATGDRIVTSGSFLVDAETRLNPAAGSIYFGGSGGGKSGSTVTSVRPSTPEDPDRKLHDSLAKLSDADRKLAEAQRYCPVLTNSRLGSMGPPIKLQVDGQPVFVCCAACKADALAKPQETLAQIAKSKDRKREESLDIAKDDAPPPPVAPSPVSSPADDNAEAKIAAALAQLSTEDRQLAVAQKFCVIMAQSRLGSMGVPIKLALDGKPVFICCAACKSKAERDPKGSATKAEELRDISQAMAKLSDADRKLAEAQGRCVIMTDSPLGSMGMPLKLMIEGKPVFICCEGCREDVLAKPQEALSKAAALKQEQK
jgi:hypothetical protein